MVCSVLISFYLISVSIHVLVDYCNLLNKCYLWVGKGKCYELEYTSELIRESVRNDFHCQLLKVLMAYVSKGILGVGTKTAPFNHSSISDAKL